MAVKGVTAGVLPRVLQNVNGRQIPSHRISLLNYFQPRIKKTAMGERLLYRILRRDNAICGPDSSIGIATDYGLDGPGSNPGGDEVFRPFRPAVGPTQSPVKWVPGLSRR